MAQTLHPDVLTTSGFSSTTAADVGSNDGTTTDAGGNNDWLNCAFPSTGGNALVTGAASQSFTIIAAKTSGSGTNDATYSVDLYQNGSLVANLGTKVLTSGTNSTDSFSWDGSQYTGTENGAQVEVRITQTDGAGGSPSKRAYVAVDEVYWTADSFAQISPTGIDLKTQHGIDFSNATLDATHDAESGDLTGVTTETGTPAASTTYAYEGTYSYQCQGDPTTRDEFSVTCPASNVGGGNFMGVDFWALWNNGIPSTSGWLWCENGVPANQWYLRAEGSSGATGQFQLSDANGTVQQNFDVNLSAGAWYNFKILWKAADAGEWYLEIRNSSNTLIYEFSDTSIDTLNGVANLANKLSFMGAGGTGTDVYQDLIKIYDGGEYLDSIPFGTASVTTSAGNTLSANTGAFTQTGQAANLEKSSQLDASSASFTLSGQAAGLSRTVTMAAETGTFAHTGVDASLAYARHLDASPGAFYCGVETQAAGHFDSSDAAIVDSQGNWLFDANAFDGDIGTFAEVMSSSGSLYGQGTNLADLGGPISLVEYRGYGGTDAETSGLGFNVYHDGGGTIRGTVSKQGATGTGWTVWTTVTPPAAGWTWADVQALEVNITLGGLGLSYTSAHAVDVRVTYIGDGQANLNVNRLLSAETGSFALTGIDATFQVGKTLAANAGAFTFTGQAANLSAARAISASTGTFTLAGQDAAFKRSQVVHFDAASFTVSGVGAGLKRGLVLGCSPGTFALTGIDATLTVAGVSELPASPGAFVLAGQSAGLLRQVKLDANSASFTLTGVDAALTKQNAAELAAEPGSFAVSGANAALTLSAKLKANTGAFVLAGTGLDLLAKRALAAGVGAFVYSGQATNLVRSFNLDAGIGAFTWSGQSANLTRAIKLDAGAGDFTWSGVDADLDYLLISTGEINARIAVIIPDLPTQVIIQDAATQVTIPDLAIGVVVQDAANQVTVPDAGSQVIIADSTINVELG